VWSRASLLNLVERWFVQLSDKHQNEARTGAHAHSKGHWPVPRYDQRITESLVWMKTADEIFASIAR
jgi:hypothetical protein